MIAKTFVGDDPIVFATFVNAALILLGSLMGILFRNRISQRFSTILNHALGLCVLGIGISSAMSSRDAFHLSVILCLVLGTILGEALRIEDRLDSVGETLRKRLVKNGENSRFTEGFVTASVLFCVGSMAIMGSIEAGVSGNYAILISKGVIDGVTSVTLAAAMGVGVALSALPLLLYQGGLTLLAGVVEPYLGPSVMAEMSAVGGTIIMGIGINMLGLGKSKIRVGNMLPAVFLALFYVPLSQWVAGLLG